MARHFVGGGGGGVVGVGTLGDGCYGKQLEFIVKMSPDRRATSQGDGDWLINLNG